MGKSKIGKAVKQEESKIGKAVEIVVEVEKQEKVKGETK